MSLAVEFWEDLRRQRSVITGLATPPGDSFSVKLCVEEQEEKEERLWQSDPHNCRGVSQMLTADGGEKAMMSSWTLGCSWWLVFLHSRPLQVEFCLWNSGRVVWFRNLSPSAALSFSPVPSGSAGG